MQSLYIERAAVPGKVDFTKCVFEFGDVEMRKNEPSLFTFSLAKIDGQPWFTPSRGDYVRLEDPRFESRNHPVGHGLVFSGYISADPKFEYLGARGGEQHWGYVVNCTSEDYLLNLKPIPRRIFVNKTRGFILRELLNDMFAGNVPFNTESILDGGIERIFATDPSRHWTELAEEFGSSDGYVYRVVDKNVMYVPQMTEPAQGPATHVLSIDPADPRFTPSALQIGQVEAPIVNDLTVVGEDEPTTACFEQFVSDGYQPSHDLAYVPYGVEGSVLVEDELSDELDEDVWEISDPDGYFQIFEGSLNVTGGPAPLGSPGYDQGSTYIRSRKAIEITGTLTFRDGEIFFPPSGQGSAILGGLYFDENMVNGNLFCGWLLDVNESFGWMPQFVPAFSINGVLQIHPASVSIEFNKHYILRRTITCDRFSPTQNPIIDPVTGYQYDTDPGPVKAVVSWDVDIIHMEDAPNVWTQRVSLGTTVLDAPQFVLYSPVVSHSIHMAMNHVSVVKPQQVMVEIDPDPELESDTWTFGKTPLIVGSNIDGGKCVVSVNDNEAQLDWYAIPGTVPAAANARSPYLALASGSGPTTPGHPDEQPRDVTTIPPIGSVISVKYFRNEASKARIQNASSILLEASKFGDDGIRQKILTSDDVSPTPRTSEECLFIARAYLDDYLDARYQGTYNFVTNETDATLLTRLVLPGDRLACSLQSANGDEIVETLEVTNVTMKILGKGAYGVTVSFGPVNRFDAAKRELIRRRSSSLQEAVIPKAEESYEADVLKNEGFNPVPDPIPPDVTTVGDENLTVTFGPSLQDGITGYECRTLDSGWGEGGEVALFQSNQATLLRDRRQVRYFFRAYRDTGGVREYSARSAMVRHTFPLDDDLEVTGITSQWSTAGIFKFFIPIPTIPDWGRIKVTTGPTAPYDAETLYIGDGVNHAHKQDRVTAFLSEGKIQLEVINGFHGYEPVTSLTIVVTPINIVGRESAHKTEHTCVGDGKSFRDVKTLTGFPGDPTKVLRGDGTFGPAVQLPELKAGLEIEIYEDDAPISTGPKRLYTRIPFDFTLQGWEIVTDVPGAIEFDIWSDTYGNFPPTVADSIISAGGIRPFLASGRKNRSTTLSGWKRSWIYGDYIEVSVVSNSGITKAKLFLYGIRTASTSTSTSGGSSGSGGSGSGEPGAPPPGAGNETEFTYYVSTDGDDSNDGLTAETAFRTITKARSVAVAGDSVGILEGTYAEALQFFGGNSGTAWDNAITFRNYDGQTVVVQPGSGADFALVLRGSGPGLSDGPSYLIFHGLVFDGRNCNHDVVKVTSWDASSSSPYFPDADNPAHHIQFAYCRFTSQRGLGHTQQGLMNTFGSEYVELYGCEIDNVGDNNAAPNSQGVYGAASNLTIHQCYFHDIDGYGYSGGSSYNGQVANGHTVTKNIVTRCGSPAPGLAGGLNMGQGTGHLFANNLVYGNIGRGIALAFFGGNNIKVYSNTVADNGGDGLFIDGGQSGSLAKNNILSGNSPNYTDEGSGTVESGNIIGTDPMFVDPGAEDYRLQAGSPAIDAGDALAEVTDDISGVARPQGAAHDAGCYEREAA